jgi:hypothetical protein
VFFEQADRVFVDRRASDADAGRRAEEVQQTLTVSAAAATAAGHERGRFVSALVADEFQMRQGPLSPRA